MLRPLLATLAILTAATGQAAQIAVEEGSGVLLDKVVAIVNDGIVTQSELDEQIAVVMERLDQQNAERRSQNLAPLPPPPEEELRKQVLDRLVLQELQVQRADRMGLEASDEQVNAALADIAQRNGIALAQLPAALSQQGINYAAFRDNIRKEIIQQLLHRREVSVNVTPRELEQFVERLKRLPSETKEYDVSLILIAIPSDATQAQVQELAQRAQEIKDRAATEDFSRLAVTYSNSPNALEGGNLGWIKETSLPTALAEVVTGMKEGSITQPLETPYGFQIYRINQVRNTASDAVQDQVHARHILVTPNELEDDATVRLKLSQVREKILNGEEFAAFASTMSEDKQSAIEGGDLGWMSPGSFVPEFSGALAALAENEISQPFRSQFGWHIVQLLGRRRFDTTEDALRERAYQQLGEARNEEETELWLRRLRDEAYVDTNP